MEVFTSSIRLKSEEKCEELSITEHVESAVSESGIRDGIAVVSTGHTTGSVHLNNVDTDLEKDLQGFLSALIPNKKAYRHNSGEYGRNADAHIKSVMVGTSVIVPVASGRLGLGQWQGVYFSEFDGPRNRLVSIKIMGTR